MSRYRKRPIEVYAERWTEAADHQFIVDWITGHGGEAKYFPPNGLDFHSTNVIYVTTLHGKTEAHVGDWIIRGPSGDFWPCKPDIFAESYEPVSS